MRNLLIMAFILLTTATYSKSEREFVQTAKIAALKGPTGLSMVKLIHGDNTLSQKMNINYKIVNTPQLVVSGLLSGEYDIGALPTNLAAILYNKKKDYALIAITGNGSLYLISSRDDIVSLKDLKGKKIYNIGRSSTPGFLFNHLLKNNNINSDDLEIDFKFNHIELAPMLIAGKADSGILPEPLVTNVLNANKKMKIVIDLQKEYKKLHSKSYPLSCIVARKDFIKKNPEFIRSFQESVKASISWVQNNPAEAGELGKELGLGITGELISDAVSRLNLSFKTSLESKSDLLLYYKILFASNPNSIGGEIPSDDFFMDEF